MVLESYCRLSQCDNTDPNSEDCKAIPSMQFNSYPRPDTPCTFQGIYVINYVINYVNYVINYITNNRFANSKVLSFVQKCFAS